MKTPATLLLPSQIQALRKIRRFMPEQFKTRAERPVKGAGYRRRPKHKEFLYEVESA